MFEYRRKTKARPHAGKKDLIQCHLICSNKDLV